jgi:6,7-dimethyl-8-ribityllumazine synthase
MKAAIIVSEFNWMISGKMLERCLEGFEELGIEPSVVKVPGAVEIPLAAQRAIENGAEVVVTLGCVVKGETDHYRAVCDMCSHGIMDVMLKTGVPIVFEVLMVDAYQKAEARIDKGYEAAKVAASLVKA